ncbi:Membrane associated signal transduction histidine kinase [Kordia algicida OT-1]|uniref:histidine kinase n=2 Tax=Kordia TaxID=221065 RepID=A9DU02_9FLAO|nr:Membrane associated signal transduction histidine kinase [Kordia algicida OT-1]
MQEVVVQTIQHKIANYTEKDFFKEASQYFIQKEFDSTLVFTTKQLNLPSSNMVTDYCHYYRGVSFQLKELYDEAEKEFLQVSKKFEFYLLIKVVLGEIAIEQRAFQKAIAYFQKVEQSNYQHLPFIDIHSIHHNIGTSFLHLEMYDKAETYLIKSKDAHELQRDTVRLVSSYSDIANLYYLQYKDDLAIPYFKKAHKLAQKISDYELKSKAAFNLAIVEENRKDFSKALKYRKEYEQWHDSLINENKVWETAQRQKQLAIKEKQKQVVILEAINKVGIAQRNGFIFSSIVLLILLGTGTYFYREKVKANKTIAAQKEALNELNATKDYLFSVVSHDLRSPVNALRKQHKQLKAEIEKQAYENLDKTIATATTISEGMYGLLNNILHWSLEQSKQLLFLPKVMRLQPTIEHVIFDFKEFASTKNISLQTNLDEEITANFDRESLKVVLRNLLDNAIKYTPKYGNIQINLSSTATEACIEIKDSGIGFSSDQIIKINQLTTITMEKIDRSKGVGLGLLLCVTLIRKNKGNFSIENNFDKGSTIKIILPKT